MAQNLYKQQTLDAPRWYRRGMSYYASTITSVVQSLTAHVLRAQRWLLPILAALILWVGHTTIALAHAIPVSAEPALNGSVSTAPAQLIIQFNEPVVPSFSNITVLSQTGQPVEIGARQILDEDGARLGVDLPPLSNGTYLVSWNVLSAVDGHNTSGTYPFGIGVSTADMGGATTSTSTQSPTFFTAGARWLNLTGLSLLLGLFVFRLLIWNPVFRQTVLSVVEADADEGEGSDKVAGDLVDDEDVQDNTAPLEDFQAEKDLHQSSALGGIQIGLIGLGLMLLAALLTFIDQAGKFDLFSPSNFGIWTNTRFGLMWLMRLVVTLALSWVVYDLRSVYRKEEYGKQKGVGLIWGIGLALSLAASLTVALVSHSAAIVTEDMALAVLVDFLHVIGAGIWVGGLVQLGLTLWLGRGMDGDARVWINWSLILNFSALAAVAVGILSISGGYLGWLHVGSWPLLFGTAYGLVLLGKVGLALPAFAIAGINLILIKPRLDAAFDAPDSAETQATQQRFGRLVMVEAVFALLVLVGAGILSDLQRSKEAPLLSDSAGELVLTREAEDLNVTFAFAPAAVGQNQFEIYLADGSGQPVDDASDVSLRFMYLGQSMGTSNATAEPVGEGRYQVEGGFLSLVGPWQVEVAIRRPGAFDAFAPFRVESGFTGSFRSFDVQPGPVERLTKAINQSGGLFAGVSLMLFALVWLFVSSRAAQQVWQFGLLLIPAAIVIWVGGNQLYTFYEDYTPSQFMVNPMLPDAQSIARGQQLYEANCAACHGLEGYGNGPAAEALPIKPPNFTDGHTDTHPDGNLHYWIDNGIIESGMPAWGEKFDDSDIWHLVNYIRRLSAQRVAGAQ